MAVIHDNILSTVGNTPVVRINKLAPEGGGNLFVKLEAFNPMASVKDRLALGVIEDAERSGALKPGQTVIEATSGNTGIGLAMVCAQKGYPLVVTMAENFSVERRKMMRFLGARVILTPAAQKGSGMLAKAVELADEHGWFLCRQFENEANAAIHSRTTAPEILDVFKEEGLDYWVTGFGTGGTVKGVARVLKEKSPSTRIVVCEPDNSQLLSTGIKQRRNDDGSPAESHPGFRPHLMQGWSPDFISPLAEDALEWVDELAPVPGDDALACARDLAQNEGIFCGISGGATFAAGLKIAQSAPAGSNILCMIPDTGERYLSTQLFADIAKEMTAEEMEISRSTANYRFDVAPPPAQVKAEETVEAPEISEEALAFVEQVTQNPDKPVVMFALEWCEFCWSVRKMFKELDIPYESVDLDSVQYQADNQGGKIRAALNSQTDCQTIPQIFVGGEFIGGCTEVFDAFKDGELQPRLTAAQVEYKAGRQLDPYTFLPTWLQPR